MAGWVRRVLGGKPKPDAARPAPPRLDPPEIVAARVASKAATERADWTRLLAEQPDIEARRITRKDVDGALRAAGYSPRRQDGEVVFVKALVDRALGILPGLKTRTGSPHYAPSQRLSLTGFVSLDRAARVDRHLMPARKGLSATAHADRLTRKGFVLTMSEATSAVAELDAALSSFDIDAALADHRARDPGQPGSAGLHHIISLVLAGDVDRLRTYANLRDAGDNAGFHPYVTDQMIHDALALARIATTDGLDALDNHLGT